MLILFLACATSFIQVRVNSSLISLYVMWSRFFSTRVFMFTLDICSIGVYHSRSVHVTNIECSAKVWTSLQYFGHQLFRTIPQKDECLFSPCRKNVSTGLVVFYCFFQVSVLQYIKWFISGSCHSTRCDAFTLIQSQIILSGRHGILMWHVYIC